MTDRPEPGRPHDAPAEGPWTPPGAVLPGQGARRAPLRRLAVAGVLVLAGALFATSARTAAGGDLRQDASSLTGLVQEEQRRILARDAQLADLRQEVDALTGAVQDPGVQQLQERTALVATAAGVQPLTGPGLEITLDDAPPNRPQPEGTVPEDLIVHQQDLQGVVNALWAAGADAIVLEDQRLITTSAVRCVGNTLKLQGRLYAPPYTVTALGDPQRLQAALDAAEPVRVYRQYVERNGLGWEVRTGDALTAPGWTGAVDLQHARALPAQDAGTDAGTDAAAGAAA
ncbi:DUF881 domain-containing protein [Quadrisphaera sp. DSM 44207]|uniref:DUF881 domain-containing protein n=1 Tax=Quadrisphaera sp. DSM 44207 TaxID=1881057 RepID=UPI00087E28CF|nr:DUF881 domain-containing protein [Quadrisphaera sp. DSM 44207]SDQ22864.1 Uncharacterized conserved protein YlxW, UPF0749 family [Quadrisphaera sp. DSM 44207]